MPLTKVGRGVEERIDAQTREYFDKINRKYLLEIVAPGTRTEADFRVQINIYEKIENDKGVLSVRPIGYVKVDDLSLESLAVPEFFKKIGESVHDYLEHRK